MCQRALFPSPNRANDLDLLLGQAVREEQLQQAFIAELVKRLVVGREPVFEGRLAGFRQLMNGACASARRLRSPAHEAPFLQVLELGIDLAVARRPEIPRRLVDERLDLIAAALAERDQPEHDTAGRAQLYGRELWIGWGHASA